MINKIIAILILVFIIILFVIYFKFFDNNNNNNDINQIYVINLKKRPERLETFKENYKLNREIIVYTAIDGNELDINYMNSIIGTEGKKSIDNYYKHKIIRKYHYELSSYGAIGCYLSHFNLWKEIIKNNINNAIIFEDDVDVSNIEYNNIIKRLNLLPNDWDIYLLINPDYSYEKIKVENKRNLYKVKRFFLLHAYIININACKKIIDSGSLFPINQQIDHHLSELALINKLNIYIHDKLSYYNTISQKTDIQINTAPILSYERFELI
jgi:GR25 family glycosyltransferase involved in LPS biosynthesis